MRGAGAVSCAFGAVIGIIPARAGSSSDSDACCGEPRDHPRACGEQARQPWRHPTCLGSSPRVRGAVINIGLKGLERGIIPARAGSSLFYRRNELRKRDHPRACGEQAYDIGVLVTARGIIPARAGSRYSSRTLAPSTRDHPRACGEQRETLDIINRYMGSSPRVRGAEDGRAHAVFTGGIIPARAGSRADGRS